MKTVLTTLLFAAACVATPFAAEKSAKPTAAETAAIKAGKLEPIGEKEAAWAAEAQKAYPLKACVVSDEALGSMGNAAAYVFRAQGQPDRLVLFCCAGCEEDFKADPAKHVAKLDAAARKAQGNAKGKAAK